MGREKTLADAFYETLKDVHFAEKSSAKALRKSAKLARNDALRQLLAVHAEESARQVERLARVFEIVGKPARTKTCEAMTGLVNEMEEDLEDFAESRAGDAVLAACVQAMEHYEIARYGTLQTWARHLGHEDAAALLGETLEEERRADARLTEISQGLNAEASS